MEKTDLKVNTGRFLPPPKLRGLDFGDGEVEIARKQNRLLMISIFTTGLCNLRCRYCYSSAGKSLPNELTLDEYKQVIKQGKELGARSVWVPGYGEPLLQKDFLRLVDFIDSIGMTLVFFTNGTMMTEDIAKYLFDRNVSVITKLNSFRKETQDSLAGAKGAYEKIQEGLHNSLKVGFNKSSPTRFGIESIVSKQNYDELPDIFVWARERNIYPYIELLITSGRASNNDLLPTPKQEKELFYRLLNIDKEKFGYNWTPVPPYVATKCNKLFYTLYVDSEGWVQPCCAIDIKVGNIREKSLKEIMKSELLMKIRNIREYLHGNCGNCKIKECFYGCRSQAFVDGDLFGSYKRCWHHPERMRVQGSREIDYLCHLPC